MAGLLVEAGYEITGAIKLVKVTNCHTNFSADTPSKAHLWLLNSCTVKTPSEDMLRHYVQRAVGNDTRMPVVLAGCVPQAASNAEWMHNGLSIIGVQQIDRVVEVVEETLKGVLNKC